MPEGISLEQDGSVLVIVNDNPATRNALTPEFYVHFREALERAESDKSIRAIVLTGAGGFFCSGGNLNGLKERTKLDDAGRRSSLEKLHGLIRSIRGCSLPIIAAVEGGAAGAGVSLALACDLVVAAKEVPFSVAYVKIGLTPDGGATSYLAQSLPRQLVTELCLTGRPISSDRLAEFGLINQLTEAGSALTAAKAMAEKLAQGPRRSQARMKQLCEVGGSNSLEAQLDMEADFMAEALGGAEGAEGIHAFLEKRKADFSKF
ncbi:oxepin-CoA hydrolase, alternative type [Rhodovibrionaceae bacterium A322]